MQSSSPRSAIKGRHRDPWLRSDDRARRTRGRPRAAVRAAAPDGLRSLSGSRAPVRSRPGSDRRTDAEVAPGLWSPHVALRQWVRSKPASSTRVGALRVRWHPSASRRCSGSIRCCHFATPASGESPCSRKCTEPPGRSTRYTSPRACTGSGTVHRVKVKRAPSQRPPSAGAAVRRGRRTRPAPTRPRSAPPPVPGPPGPLDREHVADLGRVEAHVQARAESDLDDPACEPVGRLRPPAVEPRGAACPLDQSRHYLLAVQTHGRRYRQRGGTDSARIAPWTQRGDKDGDGHGHGHSRERTRHGGEPRHRARGGARAGRPWLRHRGPCGTRPPPRAWPTRRRGA